MSQLPITNEPTDFSQQKPLTLQPNEGFMQQPQQEQIPDPLRDDDQLQKTAMDHRGSRQIAPYGTYEAVGQALENGYYTGLEALDFGTLPDGTPAALFTDKSGQRQAIRMTNEQWFAALQQRAKGRIDMAQGMRKQQDAERLKAPVAALGRELDAEVPGISQYLQVELEKNPTAAYALAADMYGKVKAKDEAIRMDMQQRVNGSLLETARAQAQNFVNYKTDEYTARMEGIIQNDNLPPLMRAQMEQNARLQMLTFQTFGTLAPPAGDVIPSVAFPSYYTNSYNTTAMTTMADYVINDIGKEALMAMPEPLRLPMLVQRAEASTQQIGWSYPWSQADKSMAAQFIANRLTNSPEMNRQYMTAGQVGAMSPEQKALYTGRMSQQSAQQQGQQYQSDMEQAKLDAQRAQAIRGEASALQSQAAAVQSQASAESQQARAEQTRAVTGIIRGDTTPQLAPAIRQLEQAGFKIQSTGDSLEDIMALGEQLSRDMTPQGRERYRKYRAILDAVLAGPRK